MRPSIMSLGATMSTPASACTSACLHQHLGHRLVVEDVAGVVEQAVLAVAGVRGRARRRSSRPEFGEAALELAHHRRHQALRVAGLAAVGCLAFRAEHREQRHHRDAQLDAPRPPAADGRGCGAARPASSRPPAPGPDPPARRPIDQVACMQSVFAHQIAGEGVAAQATGAVQRWRAEVGAGRIDGSGGFVSCGTRITRPAKGLPVSAKSRRSPHTTRTLRKATGRLRALSNRGVKIHPE